MTSVSVDHLQKLGNFAATLSLKDVPDNARRVMKNVILDALACAFAAARLDPSCGVMSSVSTSSFGGGVCTNLFDGSATSVQGAAFINGALVHALNFDAIGTRTGHTGVACIAAPLAFAEDLNRSGADFLTSAIVAAEVSARITLVVSEAGRKPSDKFLSGQLLSYFGAAAGCASLAKLTPDQTVSALGLAMMQMAGSRQVIMGGDPPAKSIYGAFPAQAGVLAAQLAKAGLDASCDLFGSPAGLYAAIYGSEFELTPLTRDLFATFEFLDSEFKPWPASNHVIPFIDAALRLAPDLPDMDLVERIELIGSIHSQPWLEPVDVKLKPSNVAAAANSAPYCVACILATGGFDLSFVDAASNAPDLSKVGPKILVRLADQTGAEIVVRFCNGRSKSAHVEFPLGHPANPLGVSQHLDKFRSCCALSPLASVRDGAENIAEAVLGLEDVASVRELTQIVRGTR
jgi:2-methylcitrate dehydratase PrpD